MDWPILGWRLDSAAVSAAANAGAAASVQVATLALVPPVLYLVAATGYMQPAASGRPPGPRPCQWEAKEHRSLPVNLRNGSLGLTVTSPRPGQIQPLVPARLELPPASFPRTRRPCQQGATLQYRRPPQPPEFSFGGPPQPPEVSAVQAGYSLPLAPRPLLGTSAACHPATRLCQTVVAAFAASCRGSRAIVGLPAAIMMACCWRCMLVAR